MCCFAGTLALGVGCSIVLADVPAAWKALGVASVVVSALADICDRVSPKGSHYVARAMLLPDGRWRLFGPATHPMNALLSSAWGIALGPIIALEWDCDDGRRRQAWLLRRDLPPTTWRRLRVRLSMA